jgi:hypothetical protein
VSRRWIVAIVGVVLIGGVVLLAFPDRGRPIDVSASQIERIEAYPYPEGSPGPAFAREAGEGELPLSKILSSVPIPLPPPTGCPEEVVLVVTLTNGREVDYGHCDYPDELQPLDDAMQVAWSNT